MKIRYRWKDIAACIITCAAAAYIALTLIEGLIR